MSKAKKKSVGMAAFNVKKKATEGVKMALFTPDGEETDEYMVILGADSKAFKNAQAKYQRDVFEISKKYGDTQPEKVAELRDDAERTLIASLVSDWSFDEVCNTVNVAKFLYDAPQILEQVDAFANERVNFFERPHLG